MDEYDIVKIFRDMEDDLINSMMRTIKHHMKEELTENINWSQWQIEMLRGLEEYRKRNKEILPKYDEKIMNKLEILLNTTYKTSGMEQEREILENILKGAKVNPSKEIKDKLNNIKGKDTKEKINNIIHSDATFFKVNDKKLNALINASKGEVKNSYKNILRYQEDVYRQTIFKAEVYANTGVKTIYQAVDMATKDFLSRGITNITYSNGAKVNIESYAEMCIRTSNKKAKLEGEGQTRYDWNEHLVLCSQYGACSPLCLPWQGRFYIDDVYSNGKADGKHDLLSEAVSSGLFHPNCRHTISTFFEGINTIPKRLDEKETSEHSKLEQLQRYNERQIRKYERLKNGSLDPENKRKYEMKQIEWTNKNNELIRKNKGILRRDEWREHTLLTYVDDVKELKQEPIKHIKDKTRPVLERLGDKGITIEGRFSFDNKEVQTHLLEQLDDLTDKYKIDNSLTLKSRHENNTTAAYYRHSANMMTNEINFNKKYFKNFEEIERIEELQEDKKWNVRVDKDKILNKTLSHEFGHLIERQLVNNNFKLDMNDINFFKEYNKVCNKLQDEFMELFKKKFNRDMDLIEDLSIYGCSSSKEFFAEAFCKMECCESSEVGEVMKELLRKYKIMED